MNVKFLIDNEIVDSTELKLINNKISLRIINSITSLKKDLIR